MSADYYTRLEQQRGPQPSEQMVASIAQGLHLSLAERDHLFRLAGHQPPEGGASSDHISPGMLRIFDRLADTPAEVVTELGETLRQTSPSRALVGDLTSYTGPARSLIYRWFTEPGARRLYPPEDHDFYSRMHASGLRGLVTLRGPASKPARLADLLHQNSPEFGELWRRHEIGIVPRQMKRYLHPSVGPLELNCQLLHDPVQSHVLLVYTAEPGSPSSEGLRLLSSLEPLLPA